MATNEQREKLKEYLLAQQARRAKMESPEFRQMEDARAMRAADSASRNNLGALLMNSAAQMGTINGRTASAQPVEDFARAQNAANTQYRGMIDQQEQDREKRYGMDARVYQYLAEKEAKQEQDAATADYRTKSLAQTKAIADAKAKTDSDQFNAKLAQEKALKEAELAAAGQRDAAKATLPKDQEKEMEALATKNAGIRANSNMMKAQLKEYQAATTEADKIRIGNSMLKTLNSLISADAISEGDAKRLGDSLTYQIANFTGAGPAFGRDLDGFNNQAVALINGADNTAKMNDNRIDELFGRPKRHGDLQGPDMALKEKQGVGEASASSKPLPPPPAGQVRVINPETGKTGFIPENELQEALSQGFKEVR